MAHKILKQLKGGSEHSIVNLVEIDGKQFVHKKAPRIHVERFFHHTLDRNGLSSLEMYPEHEDSENEIVFEYIEGSPSLAEVRNVENFRKLGEVVAKMHAISYDDFFNFDDSGKLTSTSWSVQLGKYIQESVDDFIDTNKNETHDFSDEEVKEIVELVKGLPFQTVEKHSVIHGDLHPGNILMKNGNPVMYDKDETFVVAPLAFDLAMLLSEGFNSGLFVEKKDERYKNDIAYLEAFIEGYGREVINEQMDLIKRYALLRMMKRYPHPWMDYQVEMIRSILNSYS